MNEGKLKKKKKNKNAEKTFVYQCLNVTSAGISSIKLDKKFEFESEQKKLLEILMRLKV